MRSLFAVSVSAFVVFMACQAEANTKDTKDKEKDKKIEFTGSLKTGIMAIGGETTGTIIENKKERYELDFGKNKDLRKKADMLDKKMVTVVGTLEIRAGVEIRMRRIIHVTSIEEAKEGK